MIKKSILCAILFFLLYSLAVTKNPLKWWSVSQHQWQENMIKAQNFIYDQDSFKNVLIGSSLSHRIVTDSLPDTYSLAFSGQSIYDGLNILLNRKRNPKNVFIEMNVVFRPENKDYAASLFSPILFYSAYTFRSLRADKQPIAILGAIMNRKLIGPMLRGNAVSTLPNHELFNKMLKLQMADYSKIPPDKIIQDRFNLLETYVTTLTKRGIHIVFFEMPVDSSLENLAQAKLIRKLYYRKFPEKEFQYLPLPPGTYQTSDGIHLADDDALRYTRYFRSELKSIF